MADEVNEAGEEVEVLVAVAVVAATRSATTMATHSMSQSLLEPKRRTSRERPESHTAPGSAVLVRLRLIRQLCGAFGKYFILRIAHETHTDFLHQNLREGALGILENGDRDWLQQLPQDLDDSDDENGHRHILAILRTNVSPDCGTFLENARNFLLTITHSSLLHCLAVDTHVGSIYNLFGGVAGRTAVQYLQRVSNALSAARTIRCFAISTEDHQATLLAMTKALLELLRRERRARFNDNIIPLVDSIQTASDACR